MTARTQIFVAAAILVLAGVLDFTQRIYVPRSPATRDSGIEALALPDRPLSLASARERLQSWFPTQATGAQAPPIDVDDGLRDSGAQIPDRADLAGWRFVLRGVFDAAQPFAVFDVMSSSGGEIEQHRMSAGETVNGVRVEQISGRSVRLSDGEKRVQLALFIDPANAALPVNENVD